MKTKAVVALGLLALFAAWWWVSEHSSSTREEAPRLVAPEIAEASAEDASPVHRESTAIPTRPFSGETPNAEPEAAAGIPLDVVAAGSGVPLPGAKVTWRDPSDAAPQKKRRPYFDQFDPGEYEGQGVALIADDKGRVMLPKFRRWISVMARTDDRWGYGFWDADAAPPLKLEIKFDCNVTIQTVDRSGAPKPNVPVVLRHPVPGDRSNAVWGITTGDDAHYRAHHLQIHSRPRQEKLVATLAWLFPDAPFTDVFFDRPPQGPVRLEVPDTGCVIVEVQDENGQVLKDASYVGLGIAGAQEVERSHLGWWYHQLWIELEGGRAEFPCVGLGLVLAAQVHALDGSRASERTKFAGPKSPDEEVRVVLRPGKRYPMLEGRLVDEHRSPIVRQDICVSVAGREATIHPWENQKTIATEADGRFHIPLAEPKWRIKDGVVRFLAPYHGGRLRTEPDIIRSATMPADAWERSETLLGDVVMQKAPVALSGVVVGIDGHPLRSVQVTFEYATPKHPFSPWTRNTWLDTDTRADGSFEMYGPVPDTDLRVQVVRDAHMPTESHLGPPVPFRAGTRDLRIVATSGADLAGRIVIPAGVPARAIRVIVEGPIVPRENPNGPSRSILDLNPDGSFRASSLRAGEGRISVIAAPYDNDLSPWPSWWNEELVTIERLAVPADGPCTDPRLKEIDLRGRIRAATVVVVDDVTQPVGEAEVRLRPAGGGKDDTWRSAQTGTDGRATVVIGPSPVTLSVFKRGFLQEEQPLVEDVTHVVLKAGILVEVSIAGGAALQAQGLSVKVSSARSIKTDHPPHSYLIGLDFVEGAPDKAIKVWVPTTATYAFQIELMTLGGNRSAHLPHQSFQIEALAPQRILFQPDAERLAKALEQLKQ